jgi:hypothetical protein
VCVCVYMSYAGLNDLLHVDITCGAHGALVCMCVTCEGHGHMCVYCTGQMVNVSVYTSCAASAVAAASHISETMY